MHVASTMHFCKIFIKQKLQGTPKNIDEDQVKSCLQPIVGLEKPAQVFKGSSPKMVYLQMWEDFLLQYFSHFSWIIAIGNFLDIGTQPLSSIAPIIISEGLILHISDNMLFQKNLSCISATQIIKDIVCQKESF